MRRSISVKSASQVCGNAGKTAVVGLHQLGSTGYLGHTSVQQISQCRSCSHQTGGLARKRFLRTTLLPRGRRSKCPIQARWQGGGCVGCDRTPPPSPHRPKMSAWKELVWLKNVDLCLKKTPKMNHSLLICHCIQCYFLLLIT